MRGIVSFKEGLEILADLQRDILEQISALQGELKKLKQQVENVKKESNLFPIIIEIEGKDWTTRKILFFKDRIPEWLTTKFTWWYSDWDEVESQLEEVGKEGEDYYEFEL